MPLCVELPDFARQERSYFGLPDDHHLFLYVFDFHSYLQRKNPYAAIKAFQQAFPLGTEAAGLVIKVMNGEVDSAAWQTMIELIAGDSRIQVLNSVMSRADVLALIDCCDCFVSLHRAEGFGRGPAEAMYLGKPVIATNYSGTTDFMRPANSYLVEYDLVPVQPGEYVFPDGQMWAEADVPHAAQHMRSIIDDFGQAERIGLLGQATIRQEFSAAETGKRMAARLRQLRAL
jgi:glycosyltransferase involved in cell wall biosynthesis